MGIPHSRLQIALMLAPILLVILGLYGVGAASAVMESFGYFAPIGERSFTLAHYFGLLSNREFRGSLGFTVAVATAATALSVAAGLALALGLRRTVRRKTSLNAMLQVPLAVPHLAMAFVLVHLISQSGLVARLGHIAGLVGEPADFPELINDAFGLGIVLTYVVKEAPFVALMILAVLARLGDEYENAARTLGASPWQCLRHVTLPLVAPAVVSAAVFVFAYIFSAFEVPFLLGRQYPAMLSVVAQRRYMAPDLMERPGAIALMVVASLVTVLLVWSYLRFTKTLAAVKKPVVF